MNFTITMLKWFDSHGRDLPWRHTSDPYPIWLSEIILQQTRIEQGLPYWERFMQLWPRVEDLAGASEDEVLRQWQGLGYYSRARNLHHAARQIVSMGGFPQTLEGIKSLKGVGDYTAAAIASFAFRLPTAVVDGNVFRVLARHFGISTPINSTEGKKEFAALAQELLPHPTPAVPLQDGRNVYGDFNQAMMDFGATQCKPTNPACTTCPLQDTCVAFREGRIDQLPAKLKTLRVKERRLTYIYIRYKGQTALHRRPAGDIWQGLYEPLTVEGKLKTTDCRLQTTDHRPQTEDYRLRTTDHRLQATDYRPQTEDYCLLRSDVKHVLTHQIIWADFYLWQPTERPELPDGYFWIDETDIDNYGVPRLVEILLENLPR